MTGFAMRIFIGVLLGLGAVLPGISGGVLCVMFGLYKPIIKFLSHPKKSFKKYAGLLLPVFIGLILGFVLVARLLAFLLERYENISICLFVGLIIGMFPSLLKEAGKNGRNKFSVISFIAAFIIIFALIIGLHMMSVKLEPSFIWYVFCGLCLAVSVIVPGMSFSTLLMPLGLYTPFVDGIGRLNFSVIIPAFLGAIVTLILFSKLVNMLFEKHYSVAFHAVAGVVAAATLVIVPFPSFVSGGIVSFASNTAALVLGAVVAYALSKLDNGERE